MRKIILLLVLCSFQLHGQGVSDASSILQQMKRLKVLGSVLYVAAHPDDENTRLLTYLNRDLNLRTGYLSATRGDGGQNLIGKEQGELLGLIRTQELLAARGVDGAEQFFTRAIDFGYSKNPEETFRIWNKDTILSDMVWVIRNFRPDVIICRFPPTGEGGHGHHTASAILAMEAFEAAGDEYKYSWQLNYTQTWQPRRIFWNTFNFGGNNTTSPDQLQVDVGGYNSLLGKSYGEIAAESRSMHKSQGFGSARARGTQTEYFKFLNGDSATSDIFQQVDQTWNRIPDGGQVLKIIDNIIKKYDVNNPSSSLMELAQLYQVIQKLPDGDPETAYWKKVKLRETQDLMLSCAGFFSEAVATNWYAIPGESIPVSLTAINRSDADVRLQKISWEGGDSIPSQTLAKNVAGNWQLNMNIPANASYTSPYWLRQPHELGYYVVNDPMLIGTPENRPAESIKLDVEIAGITLTVERPVLNKTVDPTKGEVYRPFEIIPAASVSFDSKAYLLKAGKPTKISITFQAHDSLNGDIHLQLPEGWKANPQIISVGRVSKDSELNFTTILTPPKTNSTGKITAMVGANGLNYSLSMRQVDYDHIPAQFMLSDAEATVTSTDIRIAGNKIGYVPGAGDDIPQSLEQLGYQVTILSQEDLQKGNLEPFNAIVTGIRAFNTNEWLQDYHKKLLDYVKGGGNLVVQYNTNSRIGPLTANVFPYPFIISRERVTDENAEVRILKPEHAAFNIPNKITQDDFLGWIQERGIYFASEIDTSYKRLLSMNDPGQKPAEGSLITAAYGKGNFVYTGLVFFRQLPAGNPGATKLFVNLLSLPPNNTWEN